MRDETRRKLDQILFRRRLKIAGAVAAAVLVAAAGLVLTGIDATTEDHRLSGRVEHVAVPATKGASQALAVDVALDDGRHVQVLALKANDPHVGDHVTVTEHVHGTGRVTFSWR